LIHDGPPYRSGFLIIGFSLRWKIGILERWNSG
jgi:hypothetical protein